MSQGFEEKVLRFISERRLFSDNGGVLVGISGGADSTALLYVLCALKEKRKIDSKIVCAHFNHNLRGAESDADERFVGSLADKLGVEMIVERLDVRRYAAERKLSIETAARQWRIETLNKVAKQKNCACIATGHHKNDNAETIIQRLLRGTGFRGLAGIRPQHKFENGACFIRPLLCVTREEIQEFLKSRDIGWRVDSSNKSIEYRRNLIRHRLIPEVQKDCQEPVAELLWALSSQMRRFDKYLLEKTEPIWQRAADVSSNRISIELADFNAQSKFVRIEIVRKGLWELGSGQGDLTEGHFNSVLELAERQESNRVLELPGGFRLWREYEKLIFVSPKYYQQDSPRIIDELLELKTPGTTEFGGFLIETRVEQFADKNFERLKAKKNEYCEWFDYGKIRFPVTVRLRREGDRFVPLGMKGEKKVGRFLTDERVPYEVRDEVLIVSDAEKIIWVCPVRVGDYAKVTDDTRKVLQLSVKRR